MSSDTVRVRSRRTRGLLRLSVEGRPSSVTGWSNACRKLERALAAERGGCELLVLELACPAEEPVALVRGDLPRLAERSAGVQEAFRTLGLPVIASATGHLAGPLLSLALRADLLRVADGMAGSLLVWQDRALPLPGDVHALAARLGRSRALELALVGGRVTSDELVERGGVLTGLDGETAWTAAVAGSRVAQLAVTSLLGRREIGRRAAEALERAVFAECFAQGDRTEGLRAFRERRAPRFHADECRPDDEAGDIR